MAEQGEPPYSRICILGIRHGSSATDAITYSSIEITEKPPAEASAAVVAALKSTYGFAILVCEGHKSHIKSTMRLLCDGFDPSLLETAGESRIPKLSPDGSLLSFSMNHVRFEPKATTNLTEGALPVGYGEILNIPLACNILTGKAFNVEGEQRPIAILYGDDKQNIVDRIRMGYTRRIDQRAEKWNRVSNCPFFLYQDLLTFFTDWRQTWNIMRAVVEMRQAEVYGKRFISKLELTTLLHREIDTIIQVREHLKSHIKSMQRMDVLLGKQIKKLPEDRREQSCLANLRSRIETVIPYLEDFEGIGGNHLERLKTYAELLFTSVTVSHSASIQRINILGAIYLPLTLVAGIFGMSSVSLPAWAYGPAAAFALLITALIAIFSSTILHKGRLFFVSLFSSESLPKRKKHIRVALPPNPPPTPRGSMELSSVHVDSFDDKTLSRSSTVMSYDSGRTITAPRPVAPIAPTQLTNNPFADSPYGVRFSSLDTARSANTGGTTLFNQPSRNAFVTERERPSLAHSQSLSSTESGPRQSFETVRGSFESTRSDGVRQGGMRHNYEEVRLESPHGSLRLQRVPTGKDGERDTKEQSHLRNLA